VKVKLETRVAGLTFIDGVVVCTIFRGGLWLDGVLSRACFENPIDEAVELLKSSSHYPQVNYVLFDGFDWSGYLVDVKRLFHELKRPVVAVSLSASSEAQFSPRHGLYFKFEGASLDVVESLLDVVMVCGAFPEPIRVARLLALSLLETLR